MTLTLQQQIRPAISTRIGLTGVSCLRGAAVRTGVKPSGDPDLALIVADEPMFAAGVFTKNALAAAPVIVSRKALWRDGRAKSIVINSGNANALTGGRGMHDAARMVETLESAVGGPGLVLSTGVIGVPLPVQDVCAGIVTASSLLTRDFEPAVPHALRTTDTCNKQASTRVTVGDRSFVIGGIAKGSGMIHPNMATMLAVVATDAPLNSDRLQPMLQEAVDASFHRITVDGDTSTNDAVLLLSPDEGPDATPLDYEGERDVAQAVQDVCISLAEQIIRDAEGATRMMEVHVDGAPSTETAHRVASSIACSSLVKTALAGGDPNWGRILAAAGNAGVAFDPGKLTLRLGEHVVFRNGEVVPVPCAALDKTFSTDRVSVRLDLAMGGAAGRCLTADLSKEYVAINSEYTT